MASESLSKISTHWTQIEDLLETDGPKALADYLAAEYFEALAKSIKRRRPQVDDLATHEIASDILYEFLKDDYRGIKQLNRDRGKLRGLFYKIIKRKLYWKEREKSHASIQPDHPDIKVWVGIGIDLQNALERLREQRPLLYQSFVDFYLGGNKISEIATALEIKENAAKQRLYKGRVNLAEILKDYKE